MWLQRRIILPARPKGFHLITDEILARVPEIAAYDCGLMHLLVQHTSASLFLNENADPDVRRDLEIWSDRNALQTQSAFVHTSEGPDDMPAHIKAALFGTALTLPITGGHLALGTWQGIYLGEHRVNGGNRRIAITIHGAEDQSVSRSGTVGGG